MLSGAAMAGTVLFDLVLFDLVLFDVDDIFEGAPLGNSCNAARIKAPGGATFGHDEFTVGR